MQPERDKIKDDDEMTMIKITKWKQSFRNDMRFYFIDGG